MKFKYIVLATIHIILVIAFMIVYDYQQITDSTIYLAVADEIASFKFHFSAELNWNIAPGYPLFLALIKPLTWHNMYLIAIFQSILFILSFRYFVNAIQSKYQISKRAILILCVFVLLNPEIIHFNGSTLTESLAASLILLICGGLINKLGNKYDKPILVLSIAFLVLTKMQYLLILPILMLYLYFIKERKMIVLTLSVVFGLLSLNGFKNLQTYGVFKMTAFNAGSVIYGGNNLNLDGSYHDYRKTKNYVPKVYEKVLDSLFKLNSPSAYIKQDSLFKRMAIEAWKYNYSDQLKVIPVKLGKLWLLPGSMDFYTGQTEIHRGLQLEKLFSDELWPWYGKWKHGAYLFIYWISLAMSIIGLWFKIKKYKFDNIDLLIISILLLNTLMYSILFYGLGRYSLPVISILFYYAVYFFSVFEKKNAIC